MFLLGRNILNSECLKFLKTVGSDFTPFNPSLCFMIFDGRFVKGVQSTLTAVYKFQQGKSCSWRYALLQNSNSDQTHMNQLPFKIINRCAWAGPWSNCKNPAETESNAFTVSLLLSFSVCLFSGWPYVGHHAGAKREAAAGCHPKPLRAGESTSPGSGSLPLGKKRPGF